MGDSITFGQYVDPQLRWTSLVYKKLDALYRESPVHILALNRGISGETTRMGLERYPNDVQNAHPDIMTLQFGLNDCNCWLTDGGLPRVSPSAFEANLVEMIARARRFGAREIILASNHPTLRHKPQLNGQTFEQANAHYSEIVRSVAARTDVTYCDIRKAFSSFSPRQLDEMLLPYPDHLHLSVKGNAHYAEAILPLIARAIETVVKTKMTTRGGNGPCW
jgi:lysophospholipase L1-like esterase